MTNKVDIKRLDSITKNDTTATEQINDNFLALQTALENTLSRDGTSPNYMDADLDMNSYRIINSADPVEDNDIVNLKYVEERIGGAVEASKTAVSAASQAASSAQSALVSSTNAINTLRNAENTINQATELLTGTQQYVDAAKEDIGNTVVAAKEDINTTIDEASMNLSDTVEQAVEDVKVEAINAANEAIQNAATEATQIATNNINDYTVNTVVPQLTTFVENAEADASNAAESAEIATNEADESRHWAEDSRVWATGEDAEVEELAPGEEEHSSRTYANFSMALANTPEDVPVLQSTLLATGVVQGPKGDKGDSWNGGTLTDIINVVNDSNHPIKITGLAGTSATGYQIVDSNGAGDSDFEHLATGDRYITRITNHNNTSNTSVSVDLYQSNVGRSVLDLSDVETILAPALLGAIYPVGSIYITTNATCPIADLGVGTWELVAADRVLQGAGTRGAVGTTLEESLPNLTGHVASRGLRGMAIADGVFYGAADYGSGLGSGDSGSGGQFYFDASRVSSTYQDGAPVQPDAYLVNIFRRIS